MKKFLADRAFADPDVAARKVVEIAIGVEAVMDGRQLRRPYLLDGWL